MLNPWFQSKNLTGWLLVTLGLSSVGCGSPTRVADFPIQLPVPTVSPTPTPTPVRELCGGSIQGIALQLSTAVSTFAGTAGSGGPTDGVGNAALFFETYGITTDGNNLYVTDKDGDSIRRIIIATQEVTTLVPGSSGILREPVGITTDGNFAYVCDSQNNAIRKVQLSNGTVTLLAGGTSGSQDGTGASAQFSDPYGITVVGNDLFVADRRNHTIRRVNKDTGEVTTLAGLAGNSGSTNGTGNVARFDEPMSMATDCTNLYVGDWNNFTVRKIVIATGEVSTLAGTTGSPGSTDGLGTAAQFYGPRGLTSDGSFLYVADFYQRHGGKPIPNPEPAAESSLIRKVNLTNGAVTTVAGVVESFGSADNTTGTNATFRQPSGVTTDGFSLFVADRKNATVRRIQ